jgi:hypothetical protein
VPAWHKARALGRIIIAGRATGGSAQSGADAEPRRRSGSPATMRLVYVKSARQEGRLMQHRRAFHRASGRDSFDIA